jgi:5'-phosphate synthase pdxT subunit
LQGDFALHAKALGRCNAEVVEVRKPEQLEGLDGLIMPGGESTTLLKLMDSWGFVPALEKFHAAGKPIFGTCAGLILLARDVTSPAQFSLGLIDVGVERNAYGRQRESFQTRGTAELEGGPVPIEMVFIRAPRIRRVGEAVETLARRDGEAVMARQGTILVATFHPELTDDPTVHRYFCQMVAQAKRT